MNLKENIDMVKDELSSEEKFFEKAVITEKFIKKYKNVIIGSVVGIVVVVAGNIVHEINKEQTIESANEALAKLSMTPSDKQTLIELKSLSPELYDVWLYSQAIVNQDTKSLKDLQSSKTFLINDLSSYEEAQIDSDISKLNSYSTKQNSIYKELAIIEMAILYMNKGEIEKAHAKLSMISQTSPLESVAKALRHYGVK